MLLLVSAALADTPACEGATAGECVAYTHFPNAYATQAEAEASCASFGGTWRGDGCPRDPATWLGECRKATWSKHYYAGVAGEAALPGLCAEAEGGTWFPRGTPSPSDFDWQWELWRKRWDVPVPKRPTGGPKATDTLRTVQAAALIHAGFQVVTVPDMERDWARVREAAAAEGADPRAREADKDEVAARTHAMVDGAVAEALTGVLPVLRGPTLDPADAKRSEQLRVVDLVATDMVGHLPDPVPACRALAAVALQRAQRQEPDQARAAAEHVRARCTDAEALAGAEQVR